VASLSSLGGVETVLRTGSILTLHLPSGKSLHILAPGAEHGKFYVRSVRLNGVLVPRTWLLHSEIIAGGELRFEMSELPSAF
jgi:putative alpha-1,2-mannosidase